MENQFFIIQSMTSVTVSEIESCPNHQMAQPVVMNCKSKFSVFWQSLYSTMKHKIYLIFSLDTKSDKGKLDLIVLFEILWIALDQSPNHLSPDSCVIVLLNFLHNSKLFRLCLLEKPLHLLDTRTLTISLVLDSINFSSIFF